ncbi:MAG: toprim domain-containing protein, partial [Limisphaerales bacterium]
GLDKSKRAILDAGFAIICEGQLDLISCFMAGAQNVVAPQGTAFTDQHARILKRYVPEVVLCFDSDEAGQNAAVRSLDHLLASGLAMRVAVVPAPHDPDSFIKAQGGEKFRELIGNAAGFFDYYLDRLCKQNDPATDKGRLGILRAMAEAVQKTASPALVDTYAQKTALRLGISPEAARSEFAKVQQRGPAAAGEPEQVPEPEEMERPSSHEFWLLKLLLVHEELVQMAAARLDPAWLSHALVRQIIERRLAAQKSRSWQNLAVFLGEMDSAAMCGLITEAATQDRTIPNPERQMADVILKLRNQYLDRQIALLTRQTVSPETPEAKKIELLQAQKKLREQKASPLADRPDV